MELDEAGWVAREEGGGLEGLLGHGVAHPFHLEEEGLEQSKNRH